MAAGGRCALTSVRICSKSVDLTRPQRPGFLMRGLTQCAGVSGAIADGAPTMVFASLPTRYQGSGIRKRMWHSAILGVRLAVHPGADSLNTLRGMCQQWSE